MSSTPTIQAVNGSTAPAASAGEVGGGLAVERAEAVRARLEETAPPEYWTPAETAFHLRVTVKALRHMVTRRQLPGVIRIGRRIRIHRATLVASLAKRAPSREEV